MILGRLLAILFHPIPRFRLVALTIKRVMQRGAETMSVYLLMSKERGTTIVQPVAY